MIPTKKQNNDLDPLLEWAVFGHLDRMTDFELILLKGHLLLETILETVLKRNNIPNVDSYSFYQKTVALESIKVEDEQRKGFIITSLREINRLRNKVAHEFHFDITNGEFEECAINILNNLNSVKFSKYTFRTKIVHSFSVLSRNMLEMKNYRQQELASN